MASLIAQKIAVIGAGLTGQSVVRFAVAQGAKVCVFDTRDSVSRELDFDVQCGAIESEALLGFDIVVVSPGVGLEMPALAAARQHGIDVIGDVELFARFNPVRVIAVTGSNGKSTVVSLLGEMFAAAGVNARVLGNIGTPVLDALSDMQDLPEWFILELSSFQLETVYSLKPQIAAILNISEDHLDRHGSMPAYVRAKANILNNARTRVLNRQDNWLGDLFDEQTKSFGLDSANTGMAWDSGSQTILHEGKPFIDFSACQLEGEHNVANIQAAALMAILAGLPQAYINQAAIQFSGIAHRYQKVVANSATLWINDSKATNPGAALASITAARRQTRGKLIVILGGDSKGADLNILCPVLQQQVDYVIAIGRDGRQFLNMQSDSVYVDSMQQAVTVAAVIAGADDTVLLAPACASLDMFSNYQDRGETFVRAIQAVAA
ncbi:UDP-N-acetylmuramoyl-L-alanine--D-glutamate ligase [Alteromonas sp. ASW11-36]|uniref:UDP-N-acetylmuramoylalanine--D-glutamate ligase n=1 Tax=Alteromonas arenosi TaxID=3055817 RepID=A0ABT7STJ7_9ALTE|nr:UDP-N-acetylmuramoyl-L-alanine--D-glutamate ligase [Alteromonas sp. ASW11-36]MDM7859528.1 UDP-N-acetylmuramoyl-L-alanine--D-glutamate ligase [Alteromonas sp. ASW11-36]